MLAERTAHGAPEKPVNEIQQALTTGRDLIRLQQPSERANGTVLIAYPDYNAPLSTPGRRLSAPVTTTPVSPHSFGSPFAKAGAPGLPPWHPLPGTAAEAEQLAPLLRPKKRITGAQATVSAVLQQMSPRIFHIATHGFFQSDLTQQGKMSEQPWMQQPSKTQVIAEGYIFETSPMTVSSNVLNLSGLVFSGANHSTDDSANDGYLTAAEVTTMNLEGTQLVTLSACETALGDLRNGEGVYGLQRSLAVAGARSTLLSLWKVDDALTALFMEEFYKRLKDGQGRADAFRNTQSWFRKNKSSTLRDVRVWGAFQLSGDWRSIRGW
jgi:CHAT domain-containing protein